MSGTRSVLVVLAALAIAQPAAASEDEDLYSRPGVYFAVGASLIAPLFEDELKDEFGAADVDLSVGINAVLGWRFHRNFSAELYYEGVKGYDVTLAGPNDFRMDSTTLTANARAYLPFERFQPYLLVGVGMAHYDIHQKFDVVGNNTVGVAGRLGGGIDVYLTPKIALNAAVTVVLTDFELDTPGSDVGGMHYVSTLLGLIYRF